MIVTLIQMSLSQVSDNSQSSPLVVSTMASLNSLFKPTNTHFPSSVELVPGYYACEIINCYNFYNMLVLNDHSGIIRGGGGMRDVKLNGEETRVIINVYGTGDEKLLLELLTFEKGSQAVGGALYIDDGDSDSTTVEIRFCHFHGNVATLGSLGGGAIYVGNTGFNYVTLTGVSFKGNSASTGVGSDIYNDNTKSIVIEGCDTDFMHSNDASVVSAINLLSCNNCEVLIQ